MESAKFIFFLILIGFPLYSYALDFPSLTQDSLPKFDIPKTDEEAIFSVVESLIKDRLLKGQPITPEEMRQVYDTVKSLEDLKKEKQKTTKSIPNPVYQGFKCLRNCENRTGYVDVIIKEDPDLSR